jgi:hypothetical protein
MSEENDQKKFAPIKTIKTEDGIVGSLTGRLLNGRRVLTFSMRKEYDRDGTTYSTGWFQKNHFASLRKLIDDLEDAITLEEDRDRAKARAK